MSAKLQIRMPDPSCTQEDMKKYGYKWEGMLPIQDKAVARFILKTTANLYALYPDDSESLIEDESRIDDWNGLFGVDADEWRAYIMMGFAEGTEKNSDMVIQRHIRGTDYLFTLSDDEESEIYNSRLLKITKTNIIIYFECEELTFSNHEITGEDIRKIALLVINRYDDLNVPYWDNVRSAITDYANTHNITVVLDGDKMEEKTIIPVPASEGDYEEFEVLGQNALFSNYRIDRSTIPDGLYAYDLRDSCNGIACELKDHITVNHFGTVIVKNPIDGAENGIALTEDDTCFFGTESTIDEFLDRSEEEDNQPEP